jgi:hypothetical protein
MTLELEQHARRTAGACPALALTLAYVEGVGVRSAATRRSDARTGTGIACGMSGSVR